MMDTNDATAPAETKRDRVRRLFIDPLQADGLRFKHGTPPEDQRRKLDQMADDLSYLSDDKLRVLRVCMRSKGEGAKGVFWPSRVSILKFAEAAQPRPLVELPGFHSWFASAAGHAAAAVPGRLLAEYQFWTKHKHPPFDDQHKRLVTTRAREIAERFVLLAEREGRGALSDPADIAWLSNARHREAMLRDLIARTGDAA